MAKRCVGEVLRPPPRPGRGQDRRPRVRGGHPTTCAAHPSSRGSYCRRSRERGAQPVEDDERAQSPSGGIRRHGNGIREVAGSVAVRGSAGRWASVRTIGRGSPRTRSSGIAVSSVVSVPCVITMSTTSSRKCSSTQRRPPAGAPASSHNCRRGRRSRHRPRSREAEAGHRGVLARWPGHGRPGLVRAGRDGPTGCEDGHSAHDGDSWLGQGPGGVVIPLQARHENRPPYQPPLGELSWSTRDLSSRRRSAPRSNRTPGDAGPRTPPSPARGLQHLKEDSRT